MLRDQHELPPAACSDGAIPLPESGGTSRLRLTPRTIFAGARWSRTSLVTTTETSVPQVSACSTRAAPQNYAHVRFPFLWCPPTSPCLDTPPGTAVDEPEDMLHQASAGSSATPGPAKKRGRPSTRCEGCRTKKAGCGQHCPAWPGHVHLHQTPAEPQVAHAAAAATPQTEALTEPPQPDNPGATPVHHQQAAPLERRSTGRYSSPRDRDGATPELGLGLRNKASGSRHGVRKQLGRAMEEEL